MGTYVDLVASKRPVLTLSGCQRREALLDVRKLVGKEVILGPKLRQRRTQDTITILLYDDIFDDTWGGRWWAGGSYLNGMITF
jgi:hypothetical protein